MKKNKNKENEIFIGECGFCRKKDTEIMYINFQSICWKCAIDKFTPILLAFKNRKEEKGE